VRPLPGFDPQRSLAAIRRRGLVYDFGYQNLDRSLRAHGVPGMRRCKRERLRCCRELRAAEPIARRVDDYVARHIAGRNVVGVHIRRGDAARNPFGRRCLESPDEVFVREIEQLAVADPEIRFFLATDCPKTQEEFVARFRGRILTYDKIFVESNYGAAKAGQADAVTEMFLLSRTRMVIGTRASTFGRMAAAIGGLEYRAPVRPGSDPETGFSV
jgi:hypothetical protein